MNKKHWRKPIAIAIVALWLIAPAAMPYVKAERNPNPMVLPPNSRPFGMTYGEWSAKWWQWALSIPAPENPLLDETGALCGSGQSGKVFFLAGVINVSGTATRNCVVPAGKALFFPILNFEADNYVCVDPDTNLTIDELRDLAKSFMDMATDLECEVDGVPVEDLMGRYRAVSPPFEITLPENNVFPVAGCTDPFPLTFPAVSDGYWVMLAPLSVGHHTIHFHGSLPSFNFTLDITYNLTVVARKP
ncbi:MAG: hypothetical protein AB1631_05640 [Acidobacteriota bacterium]